MKHFSGKLVSLLASAILLCATAMGQNGGLRFTLTDIGTFGGTWSAANAINNQGQVVGTVKIKSGYYCFLWQQGVNPTIFAGDTKQPFCDARAVGPDGTIAGAMSTLKTDPWLSAFRRDPNGSVRYLKPLPGAEVDSWGYGVYNKTVVGMSAYQAVRWDAQGNPDLVFVPGTFSEATGINSRGHVSGWGNGLVPFNYFPQAWRWQNGSLTVLPTSHTGSQAMAINDNNVMTGAAFNDNGGIPGFCVEMWSGTTATDLGCGLIGGLAISNDNWIVGGQREGARGCHTSYDSSFDDCYTDCKHYLGACDFLIVPDPGCRPASLNTLLDRSGTGWTVLAGGGINDQHRIAGWGISPADGQLHAILLTPNNLPLC